MFPKNFILALSVLAITCAVFVTDRTAMAATYTFYIKDASNYFGPLMSVKVSLDKDTYSPGESMTITGEIKNEYYYSSWANFSNGEASLNYGVNASANNVFFTNSTINNIGQDGVIGPKSITATVPSSAGTYYVNFSSKGEMFDVYENYSAYLTGSYSMPFTVKETEVAAPTCDVYFDKSSINVGEQSTLWWNSTNASSARISCSGPIPLSETDLPTINNGSVGPVTFTSAGPETCDITFKNSAGKTKTCSDSLTVNSVATPSCSMSWDPPGPITAPSKSKLTVSFTNATKYEWSCSGIKDAGPFTGSVPSTNSITTDDVNFSSTQTGTQTCTVTPKNSSGTSGASCSKSLVINNTATVPDTPTNLTGSCSGTNGTLSWSASSGATSYLVKIDNRKNPHADSSSTNDGDYYFDGYFGTSYYFNSEVGASYYAWVQAKNSAGYSGAASVSFSCASTLNSCTRCSSVQKYTTATFQTTGTVSNGTCALDVSPATGYTATYAKDCSCIPASTGATKDDYGNVAACTKPDLTAGSVSPTSSTPNTATTFSSTITNTGNASTGAGFTNLFQKATDASGTGATDIGTYTQSSALTVNEMASISFPYTFTSSGTYYIRACADKTSSNGGGVIAESNSSGTGEDNNCGAWTAITVSSTAITGSCAVSPSSGSVGTTFTWSVSGVTGGTGSYTYLWSGTDGLSGTGTSVQKSYSTSGTKTGSVAITSGRSTQTFTCYSSTNSGGGGSEGVTVSPTISTKPDLTAGSVSPTSATAGTAKTFSATISNTSATTGAGFTNLFQFDNNADHTAVIGTMTDTSPIVPAGGTDVSQVSYNFSTDGTWYVQACADNTSAWVSSIAESEEGNNCGDWTPVTVSPVSVPVEVACTLPDSLGGSALASGSSITAYQSSSVTAPSTCVSQTRTCTDGSLSGTYTNAACSVQQPTPIVSIKALPKRINKGSQTTISWVVTKAITCSITKNGNAWKSLTANDEGELQGSDNHAPQTQTIYKISCSGVEDSVTVNVNSDFEEF